MDREKPGADVPRDLLGDPIDMATRHWGRPSFEKTKELQELVIALAAKDWTQERIARQIGCDVKTLRKHFSRELSEAADTLEAAALVAFMRKLREGNLAAARKALELAEGARAIPPQRDPATPDPAEAEAEDAAGDEGPKGKKAELAEAAKQPGATWGGLLQRMQ